MRFLFAVLLIAAAGDWEMTTSESGVAVYRREVPGSPFLAVKGTGLVDAPVRTVALVLLDDARAPEWVDSLAEARVVRLLSATEYIEYNHASMPPLVSDREFITKVSMQADRGARKVVIKSVPAEEPSIPRTGIVRGTLEATYVLEAVDGKRTRLTVEIASDPKGWLPGWVVNFFQKDWATNTIVGIRTQAAKKDLKPPKEFVAFLDGLAAL